MEFSEEKAREIVKKHNLSEKTIRVWKARNSIPDKYQAEDFKETPPLGNAEKVIIMRIAELSSLDILNFTVLADVAGINLCSLKTAISGKGRIRREDIEAFLIEIKRSRSLILNTFSKGNSIVGLKRLYSDKTIKHYVITKTCLRANAIFLRISKGLPLTHDDYMSIEDCYLKAVIQMNI